MPPQTSLLAAIKFRQLKLLVALSIGVVLSVAACRGDTGQQHIAMRIERPPVSEGDVEQGRQLLREYGCGSCHVIPGVTGARSLVGPPLNNWSQRHYISGSLPNTLDNLMVWIMNPQGVDADTAMPVLGVSEEEARHMSAYLYSLGN